MIKLIYTFRLFLISLLLSCVLFVFNTNTIHAQNPVIESIIEELVINSDIEDADYSTFVEDLNFYFENPLNLNEATAEQLEDLHFLNEQQIRNLLSYILRRGGMATIYELQLVEGFNQILIEKMLPFVRVDKINKRQPLKISNVLRYGRHKIIGETGFWLQNAKGYNNVKIDTATGKIPSHYVGDKMHYKLKYKFHYRNKVFAGISAEKDQGEAFTFNNNTYGFDFYSAHLQLNDIAKVNNIIDIKQVNIGDFHAHFGQGLIMWTGFGMRKSSDVMSIRKRGKSLRYYSSMNEDNFLRGLGTTVKFGKFELTSFISYKKIDATVDNSDTLSNDIDKIKSLRHAGYHRTETELRNRKNLDELVAGAKLSVGFSNLKLGLNVVTYKYEHPIEASTKPYKLFDLQGDNNTNTSFDYLYYLKRMSFFGEAAIDKDAHIAVLNGFSTALASQLSFSLLHRYYQKNYNSHYALAFGENSKVQNEHGMYYGLEFYPIPKLKLAAYADMFKFEWLKYRVDAPSSGYEYLLNAGYLVSRHFSINFKYKTEQKRINTKDADKALKLVEDKTTTHYQLHLAYTVSDFISLASRFEVSEFSQLDKKEFGYLLYQDVRVDVKPTPLTLYLRYTFFDAAYDNRIYAYENDLLYNFSVPAFSGKGNSFHIVAKYKLKSFATFGVKYKQSFFPDKSKLGSGLSEISGNLKSYLKFQVVFNL